MFGIGGGELIFILFVVLMLFGSDKIPEIARTMGKAMAQLKNATNDIKSEIQKGAEANGLDTKSLNDMTGNITSEISKAKDNLLGDTTTQIDKAKEAIDDITGPIKRQM
jgi:sec-independent protein translocase protein TatA